MVSGELHLHTQLPSPFLCSLFSSHGISSLCSPFLRSVPPQGIYFQFSVDSACWSRSSLPPHLVSPSPTSPTFPALALCSACLPNPNTSHISSRCPGVLGNPGRFPVPAFCLLSSLVQKQQESESCLGCSCCCPGLSAWHAARTLGKPRGETNSFYYHFCTFFSPEDPLACGVSSRSALPVCPHVSLSTPRPPTRPSQHRLIPRATPLRGHF